MKFVGSFEGNSGPALRQRAEDLAKRGPSDCCMTQQRVQLHWAAAEAFCSQGEAPCQAVQVGLLDRLMEKLHTIRLCISKIIHSSSAARPALTVNSSFGNP